MTTMIERVARAIHDNIFTKTQGMSLQSELCFEVARAAIEAMREPTEQMIIDAMFNDLNDNLSYSQVREYYMQFIIAALKEE